ncbi:MAG: dephospho-CoA kinase [Xanthomarina sp.]|uniref:Dephospho-CoA kinase n=1 Tax=Xanthomarina gelatinilytica TaxID=1137281 RepID=M7MGL9_9FLAO|nr:MULTISPECIES: dephospho-CoA kinase [Xanthomarina]EMQ94216.1 Dephospho-CoA kinase [Xanthomarina gelatinilytica]MBF62633.1 dephospho-CoA kinase [Xanthomarina sp.]HAB28766.1 dephospho-CoA kinase [Xanthomarina gelatinilytica]HAI19335.1 dephospho-CoA kinase [Xanthomarina gelatinilytica]|tara:strand:- start:151 stop:738 length:588 start_codon:yes stop_codon:yes gene_type:complete
MKIVGLTGGIGSGKTTVAKQFQALGIPVYIADDEAKKLMNRSKIIKRKLKALFGDEAYKDNTLNRPFLADKIFNNAENLKKMNAVVHPKVASHFKNWLKKQIAPYVLKESAILFENGAYKDCDLIITVTAPLELRKKRLLKRDNTTLEKIQAIINNQWSDESKISKSHFVITNKDLEETKQQVQLTHNKIVNLIA